jgi:hypothetical protein
MVRLRRPARSYDLHQHLTVLLVCAVATVVFTRAALAATGYPQVGGAKLHIAHVLWGGLLMLASLITVLAFLSPAAKPLASIAGGIGFGLFIDEVGKFVTKDVNYFYKPAIAIIYVAFVALFGVIRWLSRRRFNAEEATLVGIDTLRRAAVGTLGEDRRARVVALIRGTGAEEPLARSVLTLLEETTCTIADRPPLTHLASQRLESIWTPLTQHRLFRSTIFAVLALAAAISGAEAGWLLRDGVHALSFSQRAFALTTVVADLVLLVGATRLSRSLLSALHWYDHAVLIEIVVAQIFLYASEQLEASLNLVALLAVWGLIRWAIQFESGKDARAALAPPPTAAARSPA